MLSLPYDNIIVTISAGTPPMNTTIANAVDLLYEMRLETLLSVDDLVSAVMQALEVS